jgi:hypothetical protein
MRRTLIQLDEATHAELRRLAYEQGRSMASLVRETLTHAFGTKRGRGRSGGLGEYPFVAAGSSRPAGYTLSEEHDRALADAIEAAPKRNKRGRGKRR